MKLRLLCSSLILFLIAIGFNALFNLKSFDKLYIESNVSQYRVIGKDLQRNVEHGLRYGKNLDTFVGMDRLLAQAKKDIMEKISHLSKSGGDQRTALRDNDISISVARTDGTILHSDNPTLMNTRLPGVVLIKKDSVSRKRKSSSPSSYIKHQDTYITTFPVRNGAFFISHFTLY